MELSQEATHMTRAIQMECHSVSPHTTLHPNSPPPTHSYFGPREKQSLPFCSLGRKSPEWETITPKGVFILENRRPVFPVC